MHGIILDSGITKHCGMDYIVATEWKLKFKKIENVDKK